MLIKISSNSALLKDNVTKKWFSKFSKPLLAILSFFFNLKVLLELSSLCSQITVREKKKKPRHFKLIQSEYCSCNWKLVPLWPVQFNYYFQLFMIWGDLFSLTSRLFLFILLFKKYMLYCFLSRIMAQLFLKYMDILLKV